MLSCHLPYLARFQDFSMHYKSLATVKADAAQTSFCAHGTNITWAVMDSGIDAKHPHFVLHGNVDPAFSAPRGFYRHA